MAVALTRVGSRSLQDWPAPLPDAWLLARWSEDHTVELLAGRRVGKPGLVAAAGGSYATASEGPLQFSNV